MRLGKRTMLAGAAAAIGGSAVIAHSMAAPAAPTALYAMDVSTTSGMAAMGGGIGGAMSMAFGGGDREIRTIELRLGSTRAPSGGAPRADHFPPAEARMGKALPLTSPTPAKAVETEKSRDTQSQFQRPKGRMLLYWGCGATAPKGQPVIIDFSRLAQGQIPPNLFSTRVPVAGGPTAGNSRTFGWWPGEKGGKQPGRDSSLIGEHRVAGNYAPEIKFALAQDFMPAIHGRATDLPGGAADLSWNAVAGATGYYAWAFGAKDMGGEAADMVWWTSSSAREFGGGLWDWVAPDTVRRLIAEKVVMPPAQTRCTIPAEVKAATAGFLMGNLYAYGPEANFAFPPRPAKAAAAWKPEWTARVRYRANTSWLIGGPGMEGAARGEDERPRTKPKKCKGGIGGILSGALGTGC